jgi:hypothetical protein
MIRVVHIRTNCSSVLAILTSLTAQSQFVIDVEGGKARNVGGWVEQAAKLNAHLPCVHSIPNPSVVQTAE